MEYTQTSKYKHFKEDIERSWVYDLNDEFDKISNTIHEKTNVRIKRPLFSIINRKTDFGSWNKSSRVMEISLFLLRDYSWDAVIQILKHEIAHMIVDEVFKYDEAAPHGESFKRACRIVEVDDSRTTSKDVLSSMDYKRNNRIVQKIYKLFELSRSDNKHESERAFAKAQFLMQKFNIQSVVKNDQKFTLRPIGPLFGKIPSYVDEFCHLIEEFYFVKAISMSNYDFVNGKIKKRRRMEIYGTLENLDIAEYVFHHLMREGLKAWEVHKDLGGNGKKVGFLCGFSTGYFNKLSQERTRREGDYKGDFTDGKPEGDMQALIRLNDDILHDNFSKHYKVSIRIVSKGTSIGFSDGYKVGNKLTICSGLNSSESCVKLLN